MSKQRVPGTLAAQLGCAIVGAAAACATPPDRTPPVTTAPPTVRTVVLPLAALDAGSPPLRVSLKLPDDWVLAEAAHPKLARPCRVPIRGGVVTSALEIEQRSCDGKGPSDCMHTFERAFGPARDRTQTPSGAHVLAETDDGGATRFVWLRPVPGGASLLLCRGLLQPPMGSALSLYRSVCESLALAPHAEPSAPHPPAREPARAPESDASDDGRSLLTTDEERLLAKDAMAFARALGQGDRKGAQRYLAEMRDCDAADGGIPKRACGAMVATGSAWMPEAEKRFPLGFSPSYATVETLKLGGRLPLHIVHVRGQNAPCEAGTPVLMRRLGTRSVVVGR